MNRLVLLKTPEASSEASGRRPTAQPEPAVAGADPVEADLFCDPLSGTYYDADPASASCSCRRSEPVVLKLGRHGRPPAR